ncbi:MAG: hypothetical protein ABI402_12060 [Ferruginibacter sp.]
MSITCKEAINYISKKEEGKITKTQRFELWKHMVICRICKIFHRQNKEIISSVRKHRHLDSVKLSKGVKDSIVMAVKNADSSSQ